MIAKPTSCLNCRARRPVSRCSAAKPARWTCARARSAEGMASRGYDQDMTLWPNCYVPWPVADRRAQHNVSGLVIGRPRSAIDSFARPLHAAAII